MPTRCFMPPEISAGPLVLGVAHLDEVEIVHDPVMALRRATCAGRSTLFTASATLS